VLVTCRFKPLCSVAHSMVVTTNNFRYALAADIQTIPGLPTAPGYFNVDVDPESGEIDGLF
jgi:formyltetrahydrofolate synthetase